MKRSVAIVGPTPAFLRWAISHPCSIRDLDERLAESSFRQLRAIRELSLARLEHRCIDGICIHPQADSRDVESALGFPIAEVAGPLGGENFVRTCCADCPANAGVDWQTGSWAGCFGWLPTDLRYRSDEVARGQSFGQGRLAEIPPEYRLIERVESAAIKLNARGEIDRAFPTAKLVWYQIWRRPVPSPDQLQIIERVLQEVQIDLAANQRSDDTQDLLRFIDAIKRCRSGSLELHVDLVPSGSSDGLTWNIDAFCPECRFCDTQAESLDGCPACGADKIDRQRHRSKVLGIRPYMHLVRILGVDDTRKLLQKSEQQAV